MCITLRFLNQLTYNLVWLHLQTTSMLVDITHLCGYLVHCISILQGKSYTFNVKKLPVMLLNVFFENLLVSFFIATYFKPNLPLVNIRLIYRNTVSTI